MCYVIVYGGLSVFFFFVPATLLFLSFVFVFTVGVKKFKQTFDSLLPFQQESIFLEFQTPHLVYKLLMGDIHLQPDCIICRFGGRLSLVLIEQIVVVKVMQYSGSYGLTKSLVIQTCTNEKFHFEFSLKHQKELDALILYLQAKNFQIFVQSMQ